MRFRLAGRVYDAADATHLTLRDILEFDREAAAEGFTFTWSQLDAKTAEVSALPAAEQKKHPMLLLIFAVTIWATRRNAGEKIGFLDAIDIQQRDIEVLPETADKKPPSPRKPRPKAAPASARGAGSKPSPQN